MALAGDVGRLARFQREADVLAALDLALVEGEDLSNNRVRRSSRL